jgi:hypothetical protein
MKDGGRVETQGITGIGAVTSSIAKAVEPSSQQ